MVVIGVLDIILGVVIFFNLDLTSRTIVYLIGIYILVRSFAGIFTFSPLRMLIPNYHFMTIIVSIMGILIGFQMLLTPELTEYVIAFTIAIYILIDGIQNIIYGFLD